MVEATPGSRIKRAEAAIDHALRRQWDLAAELNRELLEERPDDIEAANRLGKALTELGDLDGAAEAYRATLAVDAINSIARKNLARIEEAGGGQEQPSKAKRKKAPDKKTTSKKTTGKKTRRAGSKAGLTVVRPFALIEESGHSAEFPLLRPDREALGQLSAGDLVELQPSGSGLAVVTEDGTVLGQIEPRAASRLARLMAGGNRYEAILRERSEDGATVYIREAYRHPSLLDEASFRTPSAERRRLAPRAYTRSSLIQREAGDDLFDEDADEDDPWADGNAAKADELSDEGFTETGPEDADASEDAGNSEDADDAGDGDDVDHLDDDDDADVDEEDLISRTG